MTDIRKVGLIGGGVIGAGWAARCLLNGLDVALYDPDPEIGRKMDEVMANARRSYRRLFPDAHAPEGRLSLVASVADAVRDADFVQESLPERIELKRTVLAEASRVARPDTIFGSSTSGLLPTDIQADMAGPERLVVGHPFNPVYLMPLVEVCGGARTSQETKERAADFYRSIGMHPLMLRKEIDGFVADRLMEALWREALWLVRDGIATTEEIDDAVRYGPGLRWAFMGTFLIYRIAGGEAGMRHFMAQFGPALQWPWTKLTDVPELTDAFVDQIAAQSDDQAGGKSIRELEQLRDDCLVSVLSALRAQGYAAGRTTKRYEELQWDRAQAATLARIVDPAKPLRLHECRVEVDWIDYNGHMTESRYLYVFGNASDALFRHVGIDTEYHQAGKSYFTVESHIMNIAEASLNESLYVTTQVLAVDPKRLHIFHSLYRADDDVLVATAEQMLIHVNTNESHAVPADEAVLDKLGVIVEAQKNLPRPAGAGRHVGAPRRP
ncbi:carnitine 3-dehydrogenase [Microbaculum marinum]|uniref:L-carnitine dehydrogenase n=1 Tax=Microbaculum marinum TaxID=1764581 RepID=A0AAW9RQ16_9HYPH